MIEMDNHKFIVIKHFWAIKATLISFIIIASIMVGFSIGYFQARRDVQTASEFGRQSMLEEFPMISLAQSGITFCYDRGNIYPAKHIPTRKAMMPMFKTTKTQQ